MMICEHCGSDYGFHRESCPVSIAMHLENSKKLWKMQRIIKMELRKLEPWYVGGAVGDPQVAIDALKAIDKAVEA